MREKLQIGQMGVRREMRKNVLVYSNCSGIAEKLASFCVGEEIDIHKLVAGQKLEWQTYCTGIHLILLDIFMDEEHWTDGIRLLKEIRSKTRIPVVVLSGQKSETVKIMALDAGADDFVSTDANPLEVYARIKSQLRRYTQMTAICSNIEKVFRVDGLEVDDVQRVVTVNNREVRLTTTEYKILQLLVKEKGRVFSGDEIYEAVWGMRPIGVDNTIAVHIRHIRKKIEEDPARPHYLKVAWGKGYMVG